MKSLQIDESNALRLYPTSSPEFKLMLEDTFGKEFFNRKITDRVKSYLDACAIKGIQPRTIDQYPKLFGPDESASEINGEFAFHQLTVICEVLNEGWVGDYSDSSQRKYYPWFEWKKAQSGFGFSDTYFGCTYSVSDVGSRLSFRTSELAEYAGKTFIEIYNQLLKK